MSCLACHSERQTQLPAEIAIHLPWALGKPSQPHEFVFPELSICLECGAVEGFTVPQPSLLRLTLSLSEAEKKARLA